MPRFEHKLPSVLEPIGDICVEVTIPAHPDYVALFVRAIRMLETNRLYQRDEALSAKIVVEQWRRRTITPLIEALASGSGMCGVDGECLAYPPFAGFISYYPQNPYTEPDLIPEGFEAPPFYVNGKDAAHTLPNYETGDIIVDFGAINLEPSWDLSKTPRIELCLEGSGVAEIHFLNIVQGGVAVISLDNPVDLGDIISGIIGDGIDSIDLNQDIVALPPETAEEIIIEVEVPTEGEHTIYIYFLPTVNDSLIPLNFGGGLREISLCGNLRPCGVPAPEPPPPLDGVTELKPEFQFTADCGMEYRLRDQEDNIVQDWQPIPGWVDNAAACFGAFMSMDYDQLMEAIAAGIYKAGNNFAKQVVSGRTHDIVVGSDGAVSDPTTETPEESLPEDDPATPEIDESLAAQSGAMLAVRSGFQEMLGRLDGFFATSTPDTVAQVYMENLYIIADTEILLLAIQQYYNYRTTPNPAYTIPETLAQFFFCKGLTLGTMTEWALDIAPDAIDDAFIYLYRCLDPAQIAQWFNKGVVIPSTVYNTYPCTKIRTETITLNMANANPVQASTNGVWKLGHRMLIEITGSYTDSDNPTLLGDGMYRVDNSTGIKTFNPITFSFSGGVTTPTQAQVPYESSHAYAFTVEKPEGGNDAAGIIAKPESTMVPPNRTGTLIITITDLGEFVV